MKTTLVKFGTPLLACLVAPATALAGGEKVDVCHLDEDSGIYELITVSENALSNRLEHGDVLPGDPVPGMDGYVFGPDCELESLYCPTEGTLTETLGSHNFWFSVNGVPHGYTGTSESWTWWFYWGDYWDYFYPGDVLEFCVDEECSAPYECIVPLASPQS